MDTNQLHIEEIERKPFNEPPFTKFFVAVLRLLAKVSPIKKLMTESVGGLSGRIFRCYGKQDYEEATQVAIHALEKFRNKKSRYLPSIDHHHWWSFMKHGVESAKHIRNEELREKLIEYANAGIEPFEGYDVAYSYLEFSRWKYHEGCYGEAVKYAELASKADVTWTEPDFLLGWYGLVLNTGNAEEYLSQAIEKDQRVLFRIVNNDVCKQYPHIVNKLKAKYHVSQTKPDPNESVEKPIYVKMLINKINKLCHNKTGCK